MAIDFGVASNETVWRPEPATRGTFGLLSSCVITMILCIWTSLHLNIPDVDEPRIKYLPPLHTLRKAWWVLVGLFAPEVVTWVAFEQFRDARHLRNRMNELLFDKRSPDVEAPPVVRSGGRKNKWTLTHGFYANMGGFVFDADVLQQDILPHGRRRVTLTSLGMVELAKIAPHLVPDINIAHIRDKSKANGFAKTIALLQATWFGAQCISRLALGLTVSLLELNTLAHAICAVAVYLLWWSKPLDIEEPTPIRGPGTELICSGLVMRGIGLDFRMEGLGWRISDEPIKLVYNNTEIGFDQRVDSRGVSGFVLNMKKGEREKFFRTQLLGIGLDHDKDDQGGHQVHGFRLYMGQSLSGFAFSRFYRNTIHSSQQSSSAPLSIGRPYIVLTKTDIARFSMAQQCYEQHPSLVPTGVWVQQFVVHRSSVIVLKKRRTPGSDHDSSTDFYVGLFIAGLAYGSLHLLAWNPPVRSHAEVLIWRISAVSVIAFVPALLSLVGLYTAAGLASKSVAKTYQKHTPQATKRKWQGLIDRCQEISNTLESCTIILFFVIAAIATCLYLAGRVYLVVECFISVPRLPPSVFETLTWSQYFPHLI
ncbi:hypothetical protein QBC47DRAFT_385061 [Echria macrotheca]|uniref:Uncharacterized protein n=1 Tax=Echria macrotheca TaxID=438768 RepID=A0AAJ0B8V7_9PEZI|nr:hypothetical protein QBC47DRAFT_385061 [Echria macrotheca]